MNKGTIGVKLVMATYLNANIPIIECYVRGILEIKKIHTINILKLELFGFSSIPNKYHYFIS